MINMRAEARVPNGISARPEKAGILRNRCPRARRGDLKSTCQHTAGLGSVPSAVQEVLASPGMPLDGEVRAYMEPRLGHDFGKIRIHNDSRAAESAEALSARAYAAGRDIVFGSGQYRPSTSSGRELVAHELAHSVQQGLKDSRMPADFRLASCPAESEANFAANEISMGRAFRPSLIENPGIARKENAIDNDLLKNPYEEEDEAEKFAALTFGVVRDPILEALRKNDSIGFLNRLKSLDGSDRQRLEHDGEFMNAVKGSLHGLGLWTVRLILRFGNKRPESANKLYMAVSEMNTDQVKDLLRSYDELKNNYRIPGVIDMLDYEFKDTPEYGEILRLAKGSEDEGSLKGKVSPQMDTIRKNLSTSFLSFDWAVTDKEAHEVIEILKALNNSDLRATVAQMESEGLVAVLFDNVSDKDYEVETEILEKINGLRVHKGIRRSKGREEEVKVTGSCSVDQINSIESMIGKTKDWAGKSMNAAYGFSRDPRSNGAIGSLLDRHFLHQKNVSYLSISEQQEHARRIGDNFKAIKDQTNPFNTACAGPFDTLCRTMADAYASEKKRTVTLCPSFFTNGEDQRVFVLLHEFAHGYARVHDRGYGEERIFEYLSPDESINNADSYSLFAADVVQVNEGASALKTSAPNESISDCTKSNETSLRREFAIASRMILNALNVIGQPKIGDDLLLAHFKTKDRNSLKRVIDRFKDINSSFKESLNFECESKECNSTGYWRRFGRTVHICPMYFRLPTEEARVDEILLLAIMERLALDAPGPRPRTPAYNAQSADDAYNNPFDYVAYARDVTEKWWR